VRMSNNALPIRTYPVGDTSMGAIREFPASNEYLKVEGSDDALGINWTTNMVVQRFPVAIRPLLPGPAEVEVWYPGKIDDGLTSEDTKAVLEAIGSDTTRVAYSVEPDEAGKNGLVIAWRILSAAKQPPYHLGVLVTRDNLDTARRLLVSTATPNIVRLPTLLDELLIEKDKAMPTPSADTA
jgi:hypothetical protein